MKCPTVVSTTFITLIILIGRAIEMSTDPLRSSGTEPLQPDQEQRKYGNLVAYWILGLCNNFGYVVMLSAAHDILSQNFNQNSEVCGNFIYHVTLSVCTKEWKKVFSWRKQQPCGNLETLHFHDITDVMYYTSKMFI